MSSRLEDPADQYREISKSAVASVAFAVLSLLALLHPVFLIMPILGVLFGLVAMATIARYPEEVSGKISAIVGLWVCVGLAVSSIAYHSVVFATEVPDDHQRISFYDLKPNSRTSLPFSEKAEELDGKKVFIKGFVRPGARKYNLKDFILVGDFGSCCFGGSPKITDVVAVHIVGDMTANYSIFPCKISGTFHLNRQPLSIGEADVPQVFYTIVADVVQ